MTAEEQENGSVEEELEAPSVSEISETTETSEPSAPSGLDEETLSTLIGQAVGDSISGLKSELEEYADRKVQSLKDVRLGKFEHQMEELLAIKQEVENSDGSWDSVLAQRRQQAELDAMNAALEAKMEEKLNSYRPQSDAATQTQRKAEWNTEWSGEIQRLKDKAAEDELSLPDEAIAELQAGNYDSKGAAFAALNDLYISVRLGEDIPAAAVITEGGGGAPPASDEDTSPLDQYDKGMADLQEVIRTKGAGSVAAQEAQAALDALVDKAYEPFR